MSSPFIKYDNPDQACFVLAGIVGQESDAKIDLCKLVNADPNLKQTCTVDALRWHVNGSGVVNIHLAGETPVHAAELTGSGEIEGGELAEAGGDVIITTKDMKSGDAYLLEITIHKETGFTPAHEVQANV